MENQNPKQKKKVITKVICAVIAILLMISIAFIVANYVHKNNALPASVKNGLSAYELAVEQGYNGSLEDWLKSLDGKSAYEIAVENGYSGTEDEWNKAVATISNQNGASIKNAEFSKDGNLIITLSDGTTINVGKVAGSDGKDGANGKNGTNGKNGADGKNGRDGANGINGINGKDGLNGADGKDGQDGTNGVDGKDGVNGIDGQNGVDGKDGQDGKGISSASVNADGQLILAFSDGSTVNLDKIVGTNGTDGKDGINGLDGKNGIDGKDGQDGKDGVGIETIAIEDGALNITLSNGTTLNLGTIKGADGKDGLDGVNGKDGIDGKDGLNGTDGQDGQDGIGISNVNINDVGELVLTFSDNQTINLGCIVGKDGKDGKDGIGIENVTITGDGALTVTLTNGTVLNLGNIKGADGIGISKSEINANGELVLTYTNGAIKNLGKVTGRDGIDGSDGTGIKSVTLSTDGELIVTLTDNSVLNLGNVKGEKGEKGDKGDKGDNGKGISNAKIVDGNLILTYTDGTSDTLQIETDKNTSESSENYFAYSKVDAVLQYNKATYTGYAIGLDHQYLNALTSVVIPSEYNGLPVVQIGFIINARQMASESARYTMYFGCASSSLKSVTIPESVRIINSNTFRPYLDRGPEEVIFEQPSGWRYYSIEGAYYQGKVPEATLADPQAAAEFLRKGYQLERAG